MAERAFTGNAKEICFCRPRVNGHYVYTALARLLEQRVGEASHERLGGGVNRRVWEWGKAGHGRNIDDAAMTTMHHRLQVKMRQLNQSDNVQVQHLANATEIERGKFRKCPESSIVDKQLHIQ